MNEEEGMEVCSLIVYLDSKGSIEKEEGGGMKWRRRAPYGCFNKYMLAWTEEGNKHIMQLLLTFWLQSNNRQEMVSTVMSKLYITEK